jgi:hypothetical protein
MMDPNADQIHVGGRQFGKGPKITVSDEVHEKLIDVKPASFKWMHRLMQLPHIYAGTVDPVVVKQRRAKNKVARKSRRINRGR